MKERGFDVGNAPRLIVAAWPRLYLEALGGHLQASGLVAVVGITPNFLSLRSAVTQHAPNVVVALLPLEGLENPGDLLLLRQDSADIALVVLAPRASPAMALRPLASASAVALLDTEVGTEEVKAVLPAVMAGFTIIAQAWAGELMGRSTLGTGGGTGAAVPITARQRTVLQWIAAGVPEKLIADKLSISLRTVQAEVADARVALGATDRTHAVALALERKLIAGSEPARPA